MADIKIYGVLVNDTTEGIVTRSDQIFDKNLGKTQESINRELYEIADSVRDLTVTYDDFVTENSSNAVKSSGVFKAIKNVSDHLPYVGDDGYVYVWDPALNDYRRSGANLTGPAGETGGGLHLNIDATIVIVNEFGVKDPAGPIRVRAIRQYGQTGMEEFKEGRIRWWNNDIEDLNKPDGESPIDEDGNGTSEVYIPVDTDSVDKVTVHLYLDQECTKLYDQQDIIVLRHPTIYKLDLTNENSMVPMEDDEGKVNDDFLEPTQAILYHGATQIPFEDIEYSIGENDHDGIETATIDSEGVVTLKGWKAAYSNVSVKITAKYKGHEFYATYNIARVSGVAIYRLKPASTNIKKHKDGTISLDNLEGTKKGKLFVNVMKVIGSNTGSMTEKVLDLAAEKLSVKYTYNNKLKSKDDIYSIDDIVNEGIPVKDEDLPETLDGDLVSEIDIYLVRQRTKEEAEKDSADNNWGLDVYIDHETVPLVEDGDDGYTLHIHNSNQTVGTLADGTQMGQLTNVQGSLFKGIQNLSDKVEWGYEILTGELSGTPTFSTTTPGYLHLSGCTVDKDCDQVEIALYAYTEGEKAYKLGIGQRFHGICNISKAKQGIPGEAGYKSIIFCRTNMVPDTPKNGTSGGTYENPVPTEQVKSNGDPLGIYWHDGIPQGKEKLWSSSRYFSTYSIEDQKATTWSVPTVMSDTENMDIEFSYFEIDGMPVGDPDTNPNEWFDPDLEAEIFQTNTMIYMATRRLENGVPVKHEDANGNETSWTIVRILGEKGETALRSFVFTRYQNKEEPTKPPPTPQGGDINNPIPDTELSGGIVWSDGIPGVDPKNPGEALYPIWGSLRTFSSVKGLESEGWSAPQIMKDVPNLYDIQYSIKKDKPEKPTEDYPSSSVNEGDWFDPEDEYATPEILEQVMWMAQRWYSSDGWSPWDIIKIKGEDGKDGSRAISRMRGYWSKEDVTNEKGEVVKDYIKYDEWILCGETHKETNDSGEEVTVEEQFQDLVIRKVGDTEQIFKCLKSHKKSDAYDPGSAIYDWDVKKQVDISTDGYWMRAEKYTFIATDLLYAKELIASVISANKTEIIGEVSGSWEKDYKEGGNSILTKVTTENGKIEFSYWDKSKNDWNLSVDIGYDFNDGCGVLRFYAADGVTPLYNLGPKGLSANSVSSPSVSTKTLHSHEWSTPAAISCGFFIGKVDESDNVVYVEEEPFYDSTSETTLTLSLDHDYYYPYMRFNPDMSTTNPSLYSTYQLLSRSPKAGSFIPQLTLTFVIADPLNNTNLDYGTAESVEYGGIKFGKGTIGYICLESLCQSLSFQKITYAWEKENNLGISIGTIMPPLRRWTAITPIMTDINELNCNGFNNANSDDKIQVWYHHQFMEPGLDPEYSGQQIFSGNVVKAASGTSDNNYIMVYLNSNFIASSFFQSMTEELGTDGTWWNDDYMAYEVSGEADLMSSSAAVDVLKNAIGIFARLMQRFVGTGVACKINSLSSYSGNVEVEKGIQWILSQQDPGFPGNGYSRNTLYIAKELIKEALGNPNKYYSKEQGNSGGGYYSGLPTTLGYIFPEDKKFTFSSGKLSVSSREEGNLYYKDITNGLDRFEVTGANNGAAKFMYLLREGQISKNPGYLMLESTSSKLGFKRDGITSSGNNTYKLEMTRDSDDWGGGKHWRFKITPVDYYTAWMDQAFMYDINNDSSYIADWQRWSGNLNQAAKKL